MASDTQALVLLVVVTLLLTLLAFSAATLSEAAAVALTSVAFLPEMKEGRY
jgi:hypothetical protein